VIILKTNNEIKIMREANRIIAIVLSEIGKKIKPGTSTYELDRWAEKKIESLNAKPGFKGYGGKGKSHSFPATLCTSINNEVVHGIPSKERILEEGDIIGIDVGSIYKGFYGDGAYTYAVGKISDDARDLLNTCKKALYLGIEQAKKGNRINNISTAIDKYVRSKGYEIVRDLTGHGIGRNLHEEPQILHYDDGHKYQKLKVNMTLAIEPMITNGNYKVKTLDDDWTVVTDDGSLSAHYEHTIAITENGPEILTRL
jgi:methionyl aminopeptidase